MSLHPQRSPSFTPPQEASLYRRLRPLQKTTTGPDAETDGYRTTATSQVQRTWEQDWGKNSLRAKRLESLLWGDRVATSVIPQQHSSLNKTSTMMISLCRLMWKGGRVSTIDKELKATNVCWEMDEPPNWLSHTVWSTLKYNIHTVTLNGHRRFIYIFINTHTHTYETETITWEKVLWLCLISSSQWTNVKNTNNWHTVC